MDQGQNLLNKLSEHKLSILVAVIVVLVLYIWYTNRQQGGAVKSKQQAEVKTQVSEQMSTDAHEKETVKQLVASINSKQQGAQN